MKDVSSELAKYEIGWWKAHHRKDKEAILKNMASLYQLQFNMPYEKAAECVKYRIDAGKEHDIAEELEDHGNQKEADVHWNNAEKLIKKHFKILKKD